MGEVSPAARRWVLRGEQPQRGGRDRGAGQAWPLELTLGAAPPAPASAPVMPSHPCPPVHRFHVTVAPGTKLESGPATLHLCNDLLVVARDVPPAVVGQWKLSDLRRYGAVPNGFIFEGGTRCGYCKYLGRGHPGPRQPQPPALAGQTPAHGPASRKHGRVTSPEPSAPGRSPDPRLLPLLPVGGRGLAPERRGPHVADHGLRPHQSIRAAQVRFNGGGKNRRIY